MGLAPPPVPYHSSLLTLAARAFIPRGNGRTRGGSPITKVLAAGLGALEVAVPRGTAVSAAGICWSVTLVAPCAPLSLVSSPELSPPVPRGSFGRPRPGCLVRLCGRSGPLLLPLLASPGRWPPAWYSSFPGILARCPPAPARTLDTPDGPVKRGVGSSF